MQSRACPRDAFLSFQNPGESQLAGISRQFCIRQACTPGHDDDKDAAWRIGRSLANRPGALWVSTRMRPVILRVEKRREMFIPILAAGVGLLLYIAMRIAKVRLAPLTV